MRDRADLLDRVDGSAIDIADLSTDDSRAARLLECGRQRSRPHPALVVSFDLLDVCTAGAQEPQCPINGAVARLAGQDAYARGSPEPICGKIPPDLAEYFVKGDGQSSEVGHLGAGHETH